MIIFPIVRAVRDVRGLKFAQKSVLYTLALHASSKDGKGIYLSQDELAAEAGGNLKSCYTALKKLQEGGWITPEEKRGHQKGYALNLIKLGLSPEMPELEELGNLGDLGDLGDEIQEEIERIRNEPRLPGEEHLTDEEIEQRKEVAIAFLLQR